MLSVAVREWGRPAWDRASRLYHRYECLHYTAPPERVICVETDGSSGSPPTLTRLDIEPAATSVLPQIDYVPQLGPLLFMHERQTKSGRRSLVIVRRTMPADRCSVDLPISYELCVVDLAGWDAHLHLGIEVLPHRFDPESPRDSLRFFAGQPDPYDQSHFTIAYELNGRPGIIDGKLLEGTPGDPGDKVDLEDRGFIGAEGH